MTSYSIKHSILGFALLLLLSSGQQTSCHRKSPGEGLIPATTMRSSDYLLNQLRQKGLGDQVGTLTARAKIYAESDGMTIEANANLIWIRDSVLWVNVKKLGIEAVRALVTRDSVIVLNRLENTYSAQKLEVLQRQYSLPEGFPLLQNLLLASAWLTPGLLLQADIKDSLHRLSGANNQFSVDYRIEEGSFLLRRETFIQQRETRMLNLQFDQFKKLPGAGFFPYLRHIEAFSPDNGSVRLEIEFTDVQINSPAIFRFEIPTHYRHTD